MLTIVLLAKGEGALLTLQIRNLEEGSYEKFVNVLIAVLLITACGGTAAAPPAHKLVATRTTDLNQISQAAPG